MAAILDLNINRLHVDDFKEGLIVKVKVSNPLRNGVKSSVIDSWSTYSETCEMCFFDNTS